MIAWQILGGLFGLLLLFVVFETLKNMIAQESETRLERLPFVILRLARRRLPPEHRETVHDEEWLPELAAIVHATDGLPISRLIRGVDFAIGLLFNASEISQALGLSRHEPSTLPSVSPDGIDATEVPFRTYTAGEILPNGADWTSFTISHIHPLRRDPSVTQEGPGYVRDRSTRFHPNYVRDRALHDRHGEPPIDG